MAQSVKNPPCKCRRWKRQRFDPWVRKIPWKRAWQPIPVSLPGKSHGQRSLEGYSPWGRKESDTTQMSKPPPPRWGGGAGGRGRKGYRFNII